jgi:hypothetical protein
MKRRKDSCHPAGDRLYDRDTALTVSAQDVNLSASTGLPCPPHFISAQRD